MLTVMFAVSPVADAGITREPGTAFGAKKHAVDGRARAHHRRQRRSQAALIVAGISTTITEVAANAQCR